MAGGTARLQGKQCRNVAPDHHPDDVALGGTARELANKQAVAKHQQAIANVGHFVESMGDVDDSDVGGGQAAHSRKQAGRLLGGQRRGGFVEYHDACGKAERARQLDQLASGTSQVGDQVVRVQDEA